MAMPSMIWSHARFNFLFLAMVQHTAPSERCSQLTGHPMDDEEQVKATLQAAKAYFQGHPSPVRQQQGMTLWLWIVMGIIWATFLGCIYILATWH